MLGGEFSYTMSDGTVINIEHANDHDPELGLVYIPSDDDIALSWEQSMEMNRNLLLYGTIDRPETIVAY